MNKYESKYDVEAMYEFIEEEIEGGAPPTVREIANRFEIPSASHVRYLLHKLADAGRIRIIPRISRGIRLTGGDDE